ncbi:uncharacterized protein DNG_08378 [Cephalotrichum gorgonifer]|uniref:Zn(2)-C6 fungal-type domain-containing protein n=1 Tax=Cephalotrichum gorgonifer TaxID=2041049 RepID=A0AAE8N3E0_9PEZI|nr:uncharacterized protein DNG_08378 [Cephalotrichum gorgonifer]
MASSSPGPTVAESHTSGPSGTPGTFAASGGEGEQQQRPPPKRRKRAVISCVECHRRKQKCDRDLPCSNCKFRNKESACRYEPAATPAAARPFSQDRAPPLRFEPPAKDSHHPPGADQSPFTPPRRTATVSPLAAATQTLSGTHLGPGGTSYPPTLPHPVDLPPPPAADARLRERYKDLVRQLPTRAYVDQLVDVYFREINWQYYTIDQSDFLAHLSEWRRVPLAVFSATGPAGLPPALRAFPALLFQVLANALLCVPDEPDGPFEPIKYTGAMTLHDLALDYSDSGDAVLALLRDGDVTITTVQAGMLRASFFKSSANIPEAWHAVRSTIADAQEIGLHDDALDPKPASSDLPAIFENEWHLQRRRILFMVLLSWDIHYAAILGRPPFINRRPGMPSTPIDAPIPKDKSATPVRRRNDEHDPPTPLTRALWLYRASTLLWDVMELHQQQPDDPARIDRMHARILEFVKTVPSFLRLDSPDWRWDSHPDCSWLVSSRFYLAQLSQLALMVLHKPYVFSSGKSRTEALRAAVDMLSYQKMTFQGAELGSRKNVALFFGSLDAMILIGYTYIFFPRENRDVLQDAAQQFEWTTVRFDAMQYAIPIAKSAKGVAEAIYRKMRRAIDGSPAPTDPLSIASICSTPVPDSPTSISAVVQGEVVGSPGRAAVKSSGIGPVYPIWDILFNSLQGHLPEGGGTWAGKESGRFNGDFGTESLWSILNQLP